MMDQEEWANFIEHWTYSKMNEVAYTYGHLEAVARCFAESVRESIASHLSLEFAAWGESPIPLYDDVTEELDSFYYRCKPLYSDEEFRFSFTLDELVLGPEAFFANLKEDLDFKAEEKNLRREQAFQSYLSLRRQWGFE